MKNKKEKYKDAILHVGIAALTGALRIYELQENYEECQIIIDAINEINLEYNLDLPTQYEEAFQYWIEALQSHGCTGETAIKNLPFYIENLILPY